MKLERERAGNLRRIRLLAALAVAVSMGGAQGGPTEDAAATIDPLTQPRPELAEPLILPVDGRAPAEKIVATMPAAVRELADPSSIRVLVTLHEPLGATAERGTARFWTDARRLRRLAVLEHDFVEGAARLGFRPTLGLSHLPIVAGEISPERLRYLAALPQVRAIQPDREYRAARVEGNALINGDDVRDDNGGKGAGITVAVLDSGIDSSHPTLAGAVTMQMSFNGPVGQDAFNHGTGVAAIIAGNDQGLAPEADLWDIKVIGSNGMTSTTILVNAINALIPMASQIDVGVGAFADPTFVFGIECDGLDPASATAVQALRDAGVFMAGAAGDRGETAAVGVPACLSQIRVAGAIYDAAVGAISFAGCTDNSTAADQIACYSNSATLLDFLAPGHCTRTARAGGGFESCFGGTSASAAYVAGAAAQILSLRPQTTLTQLENALRNNGPNINDSRNGISRRRIDVAAALQSLGGGGGPTATPPAPTATPPGATATPPGPTPPGPTPTRTSTPPAPTPTTPAGSPPAAPSGLGAQTVTHTAVLLEWSDNSNNEETFRIEARMGGAGAFTEVASAPANTTFFPVEGLTANTNYTFRVRARNAGGNSAYTNNASATTAASTAACVRDSNTACLLDGRYRVTGEMRNFADPPVTFQTEVMTFDDPAPASGSIARGRAESDQAVFHESFSAGNFEVGVKMVNGCGFPQGSPIRNYWVFAGALTNAETHVVIQDTVTGAIYNWDNPASVFPTSIGDTAAFACVNVGAAGSCVANATTACLIGGRFRVTGTMKNFANPPVTFTNKVIQFAQSRAETDQAVFFQSFTAGNFEVGVKMVNGCGFPQGNPLRHGWVFYSGLTSAYTEIRVVDTQSGAVDIWRNPANTLPTTEGRTMAFDCD